MVLLTTVCVKINTQPAIVKGSARYHEQVQDGGQKAGCCAT